MRVLVFDTETTGLPQTKILSPDTLHEWPNIVQFSYIVFDLSLNEIVDSNNHIIRLPENVTIPDESSKIHGITNEISIQQGVPITEVLSEFMTHLDKCDLIVGHNIQFDINMIKVELLRIIHKKLVKPREIKPYKYYLHYITNYNNIYCTLKETIQFCNMKAINKYGKEYLKYPKLEELHKKIFNEMPNHLHNSFNDILVTLRCFMMFNYNIDLNGSSDTFQFYSNQIGLF